MEYLIRICSIEWTTGSKVVAVRYIHIIFLAKHIPVAVMSGRNIYCISHVGLVSV
jgi:hypothetical protein